MSNCRLLFLVNGSPESSAGIRAQMLAKRLSPKWIIQFCYRPSPKWRGIIPFVQKALHFRPHIIYVMDTAYTGVIAGYVAKKLLNCQLITDTGDAAFALAQSSGKYSPLQLWLIQGIEQIALHKSNYLIVRGSYHEKWLRQQHIASVDFIPDGVDFSQIQTIDSTKAKILLNINAQLVVGMVGTMTFSPKHQMCYGWEIIEALAEIKETPIQGLLVGDGNGRAWLENRVQQLGIEEKVIFTGRVPLENLGVYLSAMDICVSTQSNDLVGKVRTTGKLPLYLAHGKYVMATDVGEAQRILPEIGCLLPYEGVKDETYPSRVAKQFQHLCEHRELLQVHQQAQLVAKENFDYDILARKLEWRLNQLISQL